MKIIILTIYLFVLIFIFPPKTYAYLDPGSGSYIFQMLIGFFIGFGYVFRTSLKRLVVFLKKLVYKKNDDNQKGKTDSQLIS